MPVTSTAAGGGLIYSLKSAAFTPEAGFMYGVAGITSISVTLPAGMEGDEIGFHDSGGSSPSSPTGFGLRPFTIMPPAGGFIQNLAQSITLYENESLVLRCKSPGRWLISNAMAQPAGFADNMMLSLVRAICPVGEVKRLYAPVSNTGFVSTSIANLGITGYWLSLDTGFTIGSASSGANIAQPWAQQVFEHLWNADSSLALRTSANGNSTRGANATVDWAANKRLFLPDARGRGIVGIGQGSGLTNRALGSVGGAETHTLSAEEGPVHSHSMNNTNHWVHGPNSGGTVYGHQVGGGSWTGNSAITLQVLNSGGGAAHNNMPPFLAVQTLIFGGFV